MWFRRLLLLSFLFSLWALPLVGQSDIRINDDAVGSLQESPSIAVDSDGAILVAWIDNRAGTTPRIYCSRSTDGGFTWGANVPASSAAARPTGGMEMGPGLAIGKDNHIYMNWADIRRSPSWSTVDIYMTRSTDGGASFGDDFRINNDSTQVQHQPAIASGPDGRVYAVWHGFPSSGSDQPTPVFVARTAADGASFEPQQRADRYESALPLGSCNCCRPWIFADQITGTLYVAFRIDSANYRDIFLSRSSDRGVTWSAARRVSKGMWRFNACPGSGPAGYAYNDTVVVSWMDQRNQGPQAVYVARSTDGGESFGEDMEVGRPGNFPSVVMDGRGRIFVAWNGSGADGHIYGSISNDGGATFSASRRVNGRASSGGNQAPACAVAPDGSVYCVWQDRGDDDGDIYFANLSTLMTSASATGTRADAAHEAMIHVTPEQVTAGSAIEILFSDPPVAGAVYNQLGQVVHRFVPRELRQHVIFPLRGVYYVVAEFGMARQMRPIVVVR